MKNIKKLMTFELGLYENINKKAKRAGVTFQDYVKHILIGDFENSLGVEYADDELAKQIRSGIDDHRKGRFIEVKADDEKGIDSVLGI